MDRATKLEVKKIRTEAAKIRAVAKEKLNKKMSAYKAEIKESRKSIYQMRKDAAGKNPFKRIGAAVTTAWRRLTKQE